MRRTFLAEADLSGANLDSVRLNEDAGNRVLSANLERSRLWGAVLRGASLRRARLVGAELPRADLTGADFSNADLRQAVLTGAKMDRVKLDGADLADVRGLGGGNRS